MSLRGALQGSILSRGVASGAGVDIPAPEGTAAPVIGSFTVADNPATEGVATTFSWSLSGGAADSQILNPGDGSANYTISPGTTEQAHTFDFADAGGYDATLTVSNAGGSDSESVLDIVVSAADASFFPAADNTVEYVAGTWTDIESTHTNWGSTASNLPIKGRYKLDPGALDPATHQIYAEIGGVEYPCQISERTTYDWDDTLQFFTWHVLYSASWTAGATVKVTLKKRAGAMDAESDSRATSLITGAYTPR
jgi:PKD repeat protein